MSVPDDGSFSFVVVLLEPPKSGGGRRIFLCIVLLILHQRFCRLRLLIQGAEENEDYALYIPDNGGLSFVAALLAPPKLEGVGGFSFDSSSSSAINGVTDSISWDKVDEENYENSSSMPASDFSFGPFV